MHKKCRTMRLAFIVVFVVVRASTNLTSIPHACVCKELVNENGTATECVIKNRSVCCNSLHDSVGYDGCHYRAENKRSIR